MATRNWTAAQKKAIDAAGGSVLVSAAAGSGKTAVLVERLIRLITDPVAGCDVNKLLVVTFSNAAASEMRQRIHQALSALLGEDPGNEHLRRQKILMNKSKISTIHAFCLHLIREHFSQLGIQQDFRLLDEAERRVLQEDCARQAVSDFYEGAEENGFYALADLMSTGRDDRRLIQAIMDLYAFIRSHPFPERDVYKRQSIASTWPSPCSSARSRRKYPSSRPPSTGASARQLLTRGDWWGRSRHSSPCKIFMDQILKACSFLPLGPNSSQNGSSLS